MLYMECIFSDGLVGLPPRAFSFHRLLRVSLCVIRMLHSIVLIFFTATSRKLKTCFGGNVYSVTVLILFDSHDVPVSFICLT